MDQQAILQPVKDLFAATDARDWQKVRGTMNETVLLDYSSMTGNPAASLSPAEITDAWSAFLPGFDRTHHQLSGFSSNANGDTATVHLDGNADHYIGHEVWTVQGSYDITLKRVPDGWRILEFRFNFVRQSGNTGLPALAAERMKNQS